MCFVIMYCNIFRLCKHLQEQQSTISLCTSAPTSQTSLCLVFDEENIQWFLKHASLQSLAFRSFARLFATKLGFLLSSLAFYFLETRLAEKQIDGRKTNRQPDTAREAKLTFRIRFPKQNDMCCTLLPNVKNANSMHNF